MRYNLPLEVLYTLAPFAIIGVLFFYTVEHGNKVTAMSTTRQHTVNVVGQQWQWTFNYKEHRRRAARASGRPARWTSRPSCGCR